MLKIPLLLSACLLLVFSACSNSAEDRSYSRWDEDKSTALDEREFGNAWNEEDYFRRWDVNNDSFLDENEWNTTLSQQLSEYNGSLQEWDADGDSRLSEDEFRVGIYTYYDRDGDRMINEEEYNAWSMPNKDSEAATEVNR